MAVVEVLEISAGRGGNKSNKLVREYTRVFRVITSDQFDGPKIVIAGLGIAPNAPYMTANETDTGAVCNKITPRQEDDPFLWTVTVEYSSDLGKDDPAKQAEDPLSRPAIYEFDFSKTKMAVRSDLTGLAILNSALMPFSPPVEVDITIPQIKISINKATFDYSFLRSIQDAVNNDTWNGFAARTLKIASANAKEKFENNGLFFEYSYTIEVAPETLGGIWNPTSFLDQGFYELVFPDDSSSSSSGSSGGSTAPFLRIIRDVHGQPVNAAHLLDGGGRKLAHGDAPVELAYTLYREISFAAVP